jgi:PPOX class probable F420-dependent enzyme
MTIPAPPATEASAIPASHRDLFDRPICGVLTTLAADGRPESSLVWVDLDGDVALVNTTLERRKGMNMRRDPRVSLLLVDPDNTGRYLQVRGEVELTTRGALDQLDRLTRRYTAHRQFYGGVYPVARRRLETRVIARIHPRRITVDAIHA